MEELYTQISEYLNTQQEEMVSLLKRIVNIESGPDQPQGANEILAIFKEEFDALGLASRVIEMENVGNVLVSEYTPEAVENDRPIVLSGHMDTVFQAGVLEEHAFRETEDNFAKGAGIVDMKGGLVIALHTLKALIHTGYKKHPIKMLFISDEETLHRYSNTNEVMLDELKGAAMLLNFEPALKPEQMTVSRKGAAMVRLDVEGIAAHSGSG
ncbi:MAG TPA: M20/M25/M40 family metallo-hydrolase, partial [Atopostipes sp.]|nr:M20/M25/M40 family metallo-hydrolase [Atopostipes sp.]